MQLESENDKIQLKNIPTSIQLSMMKEKFLLRGVIGFDAPTVEMNKMHGVQAPDVIGHYKAYCLRNGQWAEFDHKRTNRYEDFVVSPHLILYTK